MIDGVIVKKLVQYQDERGWLAEIFRADETDIQPAMAYLSLTLPGVKRGPHEHVRQTDFFVFAGPGDFSVYLWDRRANSPTAGQAEIISAGEGQPCVIVVPPGVVHGYKCVSAAPGLSFNLPDRLYRGAGKKEEVDEIRWEEAADSPYRLD
ncbi:dTDP-4-dehydrorhamnose 3,5-epimerase [Candidatus Falkowbacteria bacterium CG_4_10_14_0_2_um_filter_48_10]|uniref:dTDP-4-dehydrorhamnose 3,5-epimerase n=1 Tax=Candidatus Falkowbacteria bacterium CG23_combo_of_CG06-09_8_20_14_all_49_15 TaxID=1974572 RepID=A0A2G9ZJP3_9BACT|nr:MAG: dTDP-4-dehydrorhamnose 3,5-epimerase [Candidatus Falkowbacteria bacterium CG23_combo_of_CG06-09_8_20_14_all_49_15]PJA09237.1 MAG: dTDP-4-dehydrorhamnose 3,5-epimerase [Candidatus Falkowbacteria bacterium CG_4_10_14_0_2_um_filter_48_10]